MWPLRVTKKMQRLRRLVTSLFLIATRKRTKHYFRLGSSKEFGILGSSSQLKKRTTHLESLENECLFPSSLLANHDERV